MHTAALEEASKKRLGQATGGQVAQFAEVDSYVDMLYEEMPDKIKGTGLILQVHFQASDCPKSLAFCLSRV
jgi:hypothetical protein